MLAPSPPTRATTPHIVPTSTKAIADTGSTGNYLSPEAPYYTDMQVADPPIEVILPDGSEIQSTHTALLNIPSLPIKAREAHLFPTLTSGSLISMGLFCDQGCEVKFTAAKVVVERDGATIVTGLRCPATRLWNLDIPLTSPQANSAIDQTACAWHSQGRCMFGTKCRHSHGTTSPVEATPFPHAANAANPGTTIADRLAFQHAAMCSPSVSTWCNAIDAGWLSTFPELTSALVRKHLPVSSATAMGHLDQQRANLRSTKPKPSTDPKSTEDAPAVASDQGKKGEQASDETIDPPGLKTHHLYVSVESTTGQAFTDQTGRFIATSTSGNSDMLVMYLYDPNYIHVEPMKNKSGPEILAAYQRAFKLFTERGLRPLLQKLDNEASAALQQYMSTEEVDYQLVPPHVHRRNAAERQIRTFKNHFVATLSSTDPEFPLNLWDKLLPQALLTLNLMRGSRINPSLSAWAQVYGAFDYNKTPIAPPGTRVMVHEKPSVRGTWAPHAVHGWYLGPALKHYRCYRVWVGETSAERVSDTLVWLPSKTKMPAASSADAATAAAQDLITALKNPAAASPLSPTSDSQHAALQQLATIFADITKPADATPALAATPTTELTRKVSFQTPLVQPAAAAPLPRVEPPAQALPRVEPVGQESNDLAAAPRVETPAPTSPVESQPLASALKIPKYTTAKESKASGDDTVEANTSSIDASHVTDIDGSMSARREQPWTEVTYANKTRNAGQRRREAKRSAQEIAESKAKEERADKAAKAASKRERQKATKANSAAKEAEQAREQAAAKAKRDAERPTAKHSHGTRSRKKAVPKGGLVAAVQHSANIMSAAPPNNAHQPVQQAWSTTAFAEARAKSNAIDPLDLPMLVDRYAANSVFDPATGATLEYRHLIQGVDSEAWLAGGANEIGRLAQGVLPHMPKGTDTMRFISHKDVPAEKVVTYCRIVASERPHKAESKRVRFTVGGDRIKYAGEVSTPTCDLTTVKLLLNSVISTPGAKFMTADIKDFYLNNPMDEFEYMRIPVNMIPDVIMEQYNLAPLVHNGYVIVEIRKGMYGLPQAGRIAYDRLVPHLEKHGYKPTGLTPGLFVHNDRPICFALTVDDFGVKYVGREHAEHLMAALEELYTITVDWEGTLYCGITLAWDYEAGTVDLSMPGYVEKALERFQHETASKPQHSPYAFTEPTYGAKVQYTAPEDTSPLLGATGIKRLQEVVGVFLFYARAIDSSMLVALGCLASAQTKGTEATAQAVTQLLNYAATHPDAVLRYSKSDMFLWTHSDASYLSESEARSRVASYFYLSSKPNDVTVAPTPDSELPPMNGAVTVLSTILKAVMSSATEAEMGGLFLAAKEATVLRNTLADMGHPQPASPIQTDNACAAGIVNNTVKQRRSKAMDMRFYWVRDRVKQGQFHVHWRKGADNLADYFTKHHSPAHHRLMRSRYLLDLHKPPMTVKTILKVAKNQSIIPGPSVRRS